MIPLELDDVYLAKLQAIPLDLRRFSAEGAARALDHFIRQHFAAGDECSLWSPEEAQALGYGRHWRVSWEAGPVEWGVLLTLGESMWLSEYELRYEHRPEVLLQRGKGWYSEPWYRFDVGFIEEAGGVSDRRNRRGPRIAR